MAERDGPLAGIRVVEMATMVSGPFGGQMLADLGADVIKVEPLGGDPMRLIPPRHGGMSPMFMHFNRNKRSIALDMKTAEGRAIALDLIRNADVVIENNRHGVMQRLGLDHTTVAAEAPRVVYLSVTGFGSSGPYADRPAYEHLLQAYSGLMTLQAEGGEPRGLANLVVDKSTALLAVNAILGALLARDRTGRGACLAISLMSAVAAFGIPEFLSNHTFLAPDAVRRDLPSSYFPVRTADGWVNGYIQQRQHFLALCRAFGREDLAEDPRFADDISVFANLSEVWREMQAVATDHTTEHLVTAAAREGVPLAPINTLAQFLEDPQVAHSDIFAIVPDARLGDVRQVNHPVKWNGETLPIRRLAPELGEHTAAILHELGYDQAGADALRERRVIT